ncbi:hypothetical protein ACFO0S_08260 [Chryseomicrobium palamuruense]|uniref:Uncharacterized protein n=1 Tax=Chryseomicrobium palamuruense TaxID=682973 RepID=A0ABV8UWT2_9BACL
MSKKTTLYFFAGFLVAAVIIPFLRAAGVPGFDAALTTIFGPDNTLGSIVVIVLLVALVAGIYLYSKKQRVTK